MIELTDGEVAELRARLVAWYHGARRDLPWRRTRDPYAVWVSEVMLQQTRVEVVRDRWTRWLARFPTVEALARAPLDDVLSEWAGLGYYARARNLHGAAREVAERYAGRFPDEVEAVRALPGIGRYTAGAIVSLCFDKPEPVVDGNVVRVLSRLVRLDGDPKRSDGQKALWRLAARIVTAPPADEPGTVNQALMELGATVCSPRRPGCLACPVERLCAARRDGVQERYPPVEKQRALATEPRVAIALVREGKVLLGRRPPTGLWGGLYELPTGAPTEGEPLADAAARVAAERVGLALDGEAALVGAFDHTLTHRRFRYTAFRATARPGRVRRSEYDAHRWYDPASDAPLGVSQLTRRMLDALAAD